MCDRLGGIRQALADWAERLDGRLLSIPDATAVVADSAAIQHMAVTVTALAAARVADGGGWRDAGERSAAHGLARVSGSSVGDARDALTLGRRLVDQAEVSDAARHGRLSGPQCQAISAAVTADPGAQRRLLAAAASSSLTELVSECARVKAAAVNAEIRRAQVRAGRRLRSWTDVEGVWHLHASGNVDGGAQVMSALSPIADEIFRSARKEGRREPVEAYLFDALVGLAVEATSEPDTDRRLGSPWSDVDHQCPETSVRVDGPGPISGGVPGREPDAGLSADHDTQAGAACGAVGGAPKPPASGVGRGRADRRKGGRGRRGAPVKLLLRVDYDCFLRGFPIDGETCELAGYGPVSVSAVRDLVAMGDAFVAAVMTKGHALVAVAHLGRRPNAYQRTALEWLYPTCAAEGCPAQARLEFDHRVDWAKSHVTVFEDLDRLCEHHHDLKSRYGWALVPGTTKRPFVAPHDVRHPRSQPRQPAA